MKKLFSSSLWLIVQTTSLCTTLVMPVQAQSPNELSRGHVRERRPIDAHVVNVVLSGPIQLNISSAAAPELYVSGDSNLVPKVITSIEGDTLYIQTKGIFIAIGKAHQANVQLSLPTIEKFISSGSGGSMMQGFKGNKLDLNLRGSGNFILVADYTAVQLNSVGSGDAQLSLPHSQSLSLYSQGSGNITLKGEVKKLNATVSGAGNVNATAMRSVEAGIHLTGSAEMSAYVIEEIKAVTSGSGNLSILGNPAKHHIEHTGSGKIFWP